MSWKHLESLLIHKKGCPWKFQVQLIRKRLVELAIFASFIRKSNKTISKKLFMFITTLLSNNQTISNDFKMHLVGLLAENTYPRESLESASSH